MAGRGCAGFCCELGRSEHGTASWQSITLRDGGAAEIIALLWAYGVEARRRYDCPTRLQRPLFVWAYDAYKHLLCAAVCLSRARGLALTPGGGSPGARDYLPTAASPLNAWAYKRADAPNTHAHAPVGPPTQGKEQGGPITADLRNGRASTTCVFSPLQRPLCMAARGIQSSGAPACYARLTALDQAGGARGAMLGPGSTRFRRDSRLETSFSALCCAPPAWQRVLPSAQIPCLAARVWLPLPKQEMQRRRR
jgi:hypothetical protein